MTRRPGGPPGRRAYAGAPRKRPRHTTVSARSRHTTVRPHPLSSEKKLARPKLRASVPKPSLRTVKSAAPKRQVGRILDDDSTLLDLIDNLLSKGVMLNADLILALADVDLIYIRLSALLCAADRVLPRGRGQGPRVTG